MTRKQRITKRRIWPALPPKGLRRKLDSGQQTDLAIAHLQNLDLISRGTATEDEVWHLVEQCLTWSRVAELLGLGQDEMAAQLEVATRVVERYGRTGKVGFSGVEYQAAKRGIDIMDELARLVDQPTASQACEWSERQVALLRAGKPIRRPEGREQGAAA